jgi:hypothetical protein
MSSEPLNEIIRIVFTYEDVDSMAEGLGVDIAVARERADSWADAIADTAMTHINEQLASVIEHDTP